MYFTESLYLSVSKWQHSLNWSAILIRNSYITNAGRLHLNLGRQADFSGCDPRNHSRINDFCVMSLACLLILG